MPREDGSEAEQGMLVQYTQGCAYLYSVQYLPRR